MRAFNAPGPNPLSVNLTIKDVRASARVDVVVHEVSHDPVVRLGDARAFLPAEHHVAGGVGVCNRNHTVSEFQDARVTRA